MGFPEELAKLRRERGLTQKALAERSGVQVAMLSNYESGLSEPTLGVIRKLSIALSVSADALVFGGEERVAPDESLRLAFEATSILDADEQEAVRIMLEGFLARHQNLRGGDGPRTRKKPLR